jgi:hypothetical protein
MIYATETTNPAASITFFNAASLTALSSGTSGGAFYIDSRNMNIYMNVPITLTNSKALNGEGGVFNIQRGRILSILGSSFTDITATISGSFLYSITTTL